MMIDEDKQFDNIQNSTGETPAVSEETTEQAMSAQTNHEVAPPETQNLADDSAMDASVEVVDSTESASAIPEDLPDTLNSEALLAELASKDAEVETLKAQVREINNQSIRIAADFDNYRKRTQKEKEELEQQIKCAAIKELLPVVDNFERARSQIKPQTDQELNIHKSYQSVYKQLVDCLKRIGVSPMRSEGKEFDPNLHEAVMRESTDQHPEGTVIEELMRGYMLGDRVLRHAMVKVAAAPEPVVTSTDNEPAEAGNEG